MSNEIKKEKASEVVGIWWLDGEMISTRDIDEISSQAQRDADAITGASPKKGLEEILDYSTKEDEPQAERSEHVPALDYPVREDE